MEGTTEYVKIWYCTLEWQATDKELSRWRLIIERNGNELGWAYTYNPTLATQGTRRVEFYRDTSMRLCVRKPTQKESTHGL